jgi:hypothetical protein
MKTSTSIFSILFLISFWQVHASPMVSEYNTPIKSNLTRQGSPEAEQNDLSTKIIKAANLHIVHFPPNEEIIEEEIRKLFSDEEFKLLSTKGWEAANEGHQDLAFLCVYLAAVGGSMADQQEFATHLLIKKEYKNAAKWYIKAANNKNPDVLADLYKIDKQKQIMSYFNQGNLELTQAILANFWEEEEKEK